MLPVLWVVLSVYSLSQLVSAGIGRADVCFLVDQSGSNKEWDESKQFIVDFVNNQVIGSTHTQVGVVQFGGLADVIFDLNDHTNKVDLLTAVNAMEQDHDGTDLAHGIRFAKDNCFGAGTGDRSDARDTIIVITDGYSRLSTAQDAATEAQAAGFTILAIGVSDPQMAVVRAVTDRSADAFKAGDYSTLVSEVSRRYKKLSTAESGVDMCFVVEQSDKLSPQQFTEVQQLISAIISDLDVDPDATHIGLVQFNETGRLVFGLDDYSTEAEVQTAVAGMVQAGGGADLGQGINTATEQCFTGSRLYVPHLMVVVTGGDSEDKTSAVAEADAARAAGITVLTIGIADVSGGYNEATMLAIADGLVDNVFTPYCTCPGTPEPINIFHPVESCSCTWRHILAEFRVRFYEEWGEKVFCVVTFDDNLLDFEDSYVTLPDEKLTLIQYNPDSACKFKVTWDRKLDSKRYPSMTIETGINPDNTRKYFRQVDFLRRPDKVTDEPSQRGWRCTGSDKSACPLESVWPRIPWFPYYIQYSSQIPHSVVLEVEKKKRYDVKIAFPEQADRCPGDDNPGYWFSYYFNPDDGEPTMTLALNRDFYNKHKEELSGLCQP